eukprot:6420_1
MASKQIPPETVHVFRERPLGLRLGSRNGINYVYGVDKPKPKPTPPPITSTPSKVGTTITMAEIQYNKLLSLLGKRILRVQEIDVQLFTLNELSQLIQNEKLPMYITFGEDIGIFEDLEINKFDPNLHLTMFKAMSRQPPSQYVAMDVQRMTLLFFSVFAIDILCDLNVYYNSTKELKEERNDIINWVYAQQIIRNKAQNIDYAGFRGGSFVGVPFDNNSKPEAQRLHLDKWDRVNMASTHNAICLLIGLGDDLKQLDRQGIINTVRMLQDPVTGSFCSMIDGEVDMRFIYCACVISHVLNDWSGIDVDKATQFIVNCQSYDGSLGFGTDAEGHGGSTFVGVAALVLMNQLHKIDTNALLRWLMFNQGNGFKGRPEKPPDSCYSFWCGAVLSMLSSYKERMRDEEGDQKEECEVLNVMELKGFYHGENKEFYNLCNHRFNRIFNLYCQSGFGGFAKLPSIPFGDILHGYMGLAGLSMMAHKIPQELHEKHSEQFPHLFKKKLFPITSCSVSYHDIVSNHVDK